MNRYAVIDFETTGLSPNQGDRAIEVAVVIVEQNKLIDEYQSLMNPDIAISDFISQLTGITNQMVEKAPASSAVMHQAIQFVGDATIVAHNAAFDRMFWEKELSLLNISKPNPFICTMQISQRLYPSSPNHKLKTLVEFNNIKRADSYHRALADAKYTAELLLRIHKDIAKLYPENQINPGFLQNYQTCRKADVKHT